MSSDKIGLGRYNAYNGRYIAIMIIFSDHAKAQIKKRKILKTVVLFTVTNPQEVKKSFRGRIIRRRKVGNKILEVITVTEEARIEIVTAYYIEG